MATPNAGRAVAVGDPVPGQIPNLTDGDRSAAAHPDAVGQAVSASRQNLARQKSGNEFQELPDDLYRNPEDYMSAQVSAKQMDPNNLSLFYSFGFDATKRSNIYYLNDTTIVTAVGNVLTIVNLRTMDQQYVIGLRGGGIGSIAVCGHVDILLFLDNVLKAELSKVDPSRKYIAVGEIHDEGPNIYVYEFPSLKLYRVLMEGAVHGYANLCFNNAGDKLASVGMDPDYMLTLWNWKQERVILRSKAFSQDVYRVAFSPESDGNLTTSGMGHIKFWSMSSTFTGLKLQGYLGKFGGSELTDIAAFIQLPDGKVLSSTETGNMLLWDGGMIKCEIASKGKRLCHQGRIEVVLLVEGEVFTAGEDGFVRVWDFESIDNADVTSTGAGGSESGGGGQNAGATQPRVFEIEPIDEIIVGKDVKIKSMVKSQGSANEYLLVDENGHLFRLDTKKRTADKILSFHSGAVVSVDTSPLAHSMASLGADGSLRVYDYITKTVVGQVKYADGGSAMTYAPESLDATGSTIFAGFSDGVLRVVSHTPIALGGGTCSFHLHYVLKPHKARITAIAVSSDATYLATASEDRTMFFFKINATLPAAMGEQQPPMIFNRTNVQIIPIGFVTMDSPVESISFSPDNHLNIDEIEPAGDDEEEKGKDEEQVEEDIGDGKRAFVTLKDGRLMAMIIPSAEQVDNTLSFELPEGSVKATRWTLDVPEPKPTAPAPAPASGAAEGEGGAGAPASETSPEPPAEQTPKVEQRGTSAARKARGLVIESGSPITRALYLEGGYFLVALLNKDGEAEIRACKFGNPKMSR
ncbi:hypothetical protein HDV00_010203 [Rhizophlyctis rosea]|nr:hypothetical protein HDV00_010203 [Rhizophlyctis rosea]